MNPRTPCLAAAVALTLALPAAAQASAPRDVPAKAVPVPGTISPQMQAIVAQPLRADWDKLLLSNTVRMQRALRRAGVEAELQVYEAQSHAQFYRDDRIPEVREAFGEIGQFLDRHLGK